MGGFHVDTDSLRQAAAVIDRAPEESGWRGYELIAPTDSGNNDFDRAATEFATGWRGTALGLVNSSDGLSRALRENANGYEAADTLSGFELE